jgi:PAS domain S-box-containing protein
MGVFISIVAELYRRNRNKAAAYDREAALRESEERYRTLFNTMTEGFALHEIITDDQGRPCDYRFLDVNPAFERLTGLNRGDLIGKRVREAIPGIEPHWIESYGRVILTGQPLTMENYAVELKRWYQVFAYRIAPGRFAVVFSDITARKQAAEELHAINKTLEERVAERTAEAERRALQLRKLAAELTLAEQRERQRISMVLHDGLQQILVAAKFQIALLEKTTDVKKKAAELAELIDDGIETSRSLTAELSPPILKQGGLVPALEWLVKWMHDKHGLSVSLTSHGEIESAPEDVVLLLFQSVRELLFNVTKHAGVRTARVEVMQKAGQIRVDVEDEGVGFDPNQLIGEGAKSRGMGLFSIQERLSYLGGSMEIDSSPGRGSRFGLIAAPLSMETTTPAIREQSIVSITMASRLKVAAGSEKKIRAILVDDHMVMRQGLAGMLRAEPDIEIIGEASDGQSGIELVRELCPDIVLMDINMPGMDGIQATRIIHKELPGVKVIGLSMFQEEVQQTAMRDAGAVNYLTKSGQADALIEAIRAASKF